MDSDNRSWPLRIVAGIWRGLDRLRRLLHLIVLLAIFLLLLVVSIGERVYIPGAAALEAPQHGGGLAALGSKNLLDRPAGPEVVFGLGAHRRGRAAPRHVPGAGRPSRIKDRRDVGPRGAARERQPRPGA